MYFYAQTTGAAMSAPDGCACLEFMSAALIAAGELYLGRTCRAVNLHRLPALSIYFFIIGQARINRLSDHNISHRIFKIKVIIPVTARQEYTDRPGL